jgi:hypothetical protein
VDSSAALPTPASARQVVDNPLLINIEPDVA